MKATRQKSDIKEQNENEAALQQQRNEKTECGEWQRKRNFLTITQRALINYVSSLHDTLTFASLRHRDVQTMNTFIQNFSLYPAAHQVDAAFARNAR